MGKWMRGPLADYVGVDIAAQSLEDFVQRLLTRSEQERRKVSLLVAADLSSQALRRDSCRCFSWAAQWRDGATPFPAACARRDYFHVASCQFAVHYMLQRQSTAAHFFQEVAQSLQPGGLFLATTIDARALVQHFLLAQHSRLDSLRYEHSDGHHRLIVCNELGQRLLTVHMRDAIYSRIVASAHPEHAEDDCFGLEYVFSLHDGDGVLAVNAPECLVLPEHAALRAVWTGCGLRVLGQVGFQAFFQTLQLQAQARRDAAFLDR
jgi:hypothetical protein